MCFSLAVYSSIPLHYNSRVKQTVVFGPIRNSHLEPIAGCMSAVAPKLPIAAPAINVHNPLAQQEMDLDALTYSGETSTFQTFVC